MNLYWFLLSFCTRFLAYALPKFREKDQWKYISALIYPRLEALCPLTALLCPHLYQSEILNWKHHSAPPLGADMARGLSKAIHSSSEDQARLLWIAEQDNQKTAFCWCLHVVRLGSGHPAQQCLPSWDGWNQPQLWARLTGIMLSVRIKISRIPSRS